MKKNFKFDKLLLDRQFDNLKNKKKTDLNDVVLIASALQQQMIIDAGYYKPYKKINYKNYKRSSSKKEESIPEFLPKLVNKNIEIEHDSEKEIFSRRKHYMSNLSLAQKIGLYEMPKMPLSIQEWKQIEKTSTTRQDHTASCPICLDDLKARNTVILSCSHIFHKVIILIKIIINSYL